MDLTQIDNFQVRLLQIVYSNSPDHITLIETNPTAALILVLISLAVLARAQQYQSRPDRIDTHYPRNQSHQTTIEHYPSETAKARHRTLFDTRATSLVGKAGH